MAKLSFIFGKNWWKALAVVLLIYVSIGGFLMPVPRLPILNESIRVLFFHVPMWFGMVILLSISVVNSILYMRKPLAIYDARAEAYAYTGVLFGVLGLVTGMVWAWVTWGEPWSGDPKQNSSAIALLVYFAYITLRNAFDDPLQKARISSVYNIFAYATLIPLLFILPRLSDNSLHPGVGGNPGFNSYDLDSQLRILFYPAVIGWSLLGVWLTQLKVRFFRLEQKYN